MNNYIKDLFKIKKNLSRLAISILVLAIIAGVALRIAGAVGKKTIDHDEGISYLSATGHQGEYSRVMDGAYPFGAWVKASEWKRLIRVDKMFCFGQISRDLAHYDIHPPLYFWLLHLWSLVVGVNLWTGPSLNILFVVIAAFFLFRFARYILGNSVEAALAVFIWLVSPEVLPISLTARQYDLAAFLEIVFIYQIIKSADLRERFKLPEFILLAVSTAAGALTHYNFFFIIAGCCGFLFIKLISEDRYRLIKNFVSVGFGCVLFFFLNPGFYSCFARERGQAQPFNYDGIILRTKAISVSFSSFFSLPARWFSYNYLWAILAIALICIFLNSYRKSRLGMIAYIRKIDFKGYYIFYLLLWVVGTQVIAYLMFLFPAHAVGGRYFCMIWPLLSCATVFMLRFFGKFRVILAILLCFSLFAASSNKLRNLKYINVPPVILQDSRCFLADNVSRGVFPCFFWHLPDDTMVYAANQDHLIGKRENWLNNIGDNAFYFSSITYGNTKEKQDRILELIKREYDVSLFETGSYSYLFRISGRSIK